MNGIFLKRKLDIITAPLPELTFGQRIFLKLFLLVTEHLITVENQEQLQNTPEPLIFAFNHNSSFEALLVPMYLIYRRNGRKINFVIDWMFGEIPLLSLILSQVDPIYAYHKKSTIPFLNSIRDEIHQPIYLQCVERLAKKTSLGIFPEGTRNQSPEWLLKGHKGIGYIALESKVPVLPIGIDFPVRRTKGKIPKLGRITLRIGKPLRFDKEIEVYQKALIDTNYQYSKLKKLVRVLASQITYQVMKQLECLSGKKYPFPAPSFQLPRETVGINKLYTEGGNVNGFFRNQYYEGNRF